jgi:hypothetical protein
VPDWLDHWQVIPAPLAQLIDRNEMSTFVLTTRMLLYSGTPFEATFADISAAASVRRTDETRKNNPKLYSAALSGFSGF